MASNAGQVGDVAAARRLLAHALSDLAAVVLGRPEVDLGCGRGSVTHAAHELRQTRSGLRCSDHAEMPQIMDPDVIAADPVERSSQGLAVCAEDVSIG